MTADINIGDNYQLDEDSNGDLVIKDGNGDTVFTHDNSAGVWTLNDNVRVPDIIDDSSGNTVYDTSTETVGDGNQDGDLASLDTDDINIGGKDLVASGDVLPLSGYAPGTRVSASTATSTYSDANSLLEFEVKWNDLIPAGATGVINLSATLIPGTDEEVFVSMRSSDNTTVAEFSATATDRVSSGWVAYTPLSASTTETYRAQIKTSPATNSSTVRQVNAVIGIQL